MALVASLLGLLSDNLPTLLIFIVAFLLVVHHRSKPANLPPGVRSLPVVGSVPFLGRKLHEVLTGYRATLGDVFHMYLGPELVVVLNGYEAIREAFVKHGDVFIGRRVDKVTWAMSHGKGVIFANGQLWKEQRRFALNVLRDFGMGRTLMEDRAQDEVRALLQRVESHGGAPFNPQILLTNAVSNVICSLVFGKRYDYDDETFKSYIGRLNDHVKYIGRTQLINVFPFLRYCPYDPTRFHFLVSNIQAIEGWLREHLEQHRKNFNPSRIEDFIDAYLKEIDDQQSAGAQDTNFNDGQLFKLIQDLFFAGTETTSNTLRWGLLCMMLYPDVQERVQQEIDSVLGSERLPCLRDRARLPYTEATLHEIQRFSSLLSFTIPHRTTEHATFRGYDIPAGTTVFANLWSIFRDPKVFPEPERFNPGRFMKDENENVAKPDELIPFGIGRRSCLGESLARMELFFFFTSLLQRFTFRFENDSKRPTNFDAGIGIVLSSPAYEMCATRRTNLDL